MMKMTLSLTIAASLFCTAALAAPMEAPHLPGSLRMNEIQVLGTHNSYAQGLDPRVSALFEQAMTKSVGNYIERMPAPARALFQEEHPNLMLPSEMLKYAHPGLTAQLDLGVRSLEIDVNPDPAGGQFVRPVSYRMLREQGVTDLLPFDDTGLREPGFKVLHIPDIDFRSSCPTLRQCLQQVRTWSDANAGHIPLFLLIEAKNQDVPILPGATQTVPFSPGLFDDLDHELMSVLGRDRIITPDDVRGTYATLNEAIRAGQWPTLDAARGKVVLLMLTANGPGATADYLKDHPSLRGRMAFLRAQPGEDHAAFLMFDNALVRAQEIRQYVQQGYLVRTRSDIETHEAKTNSLERANAAFASGAQVVSTDFEMPGNAYGTSYVVRLPGGAAARCRPHLKVPCMPAKH
ncbi:Ca2+-dependent phosphoinositide-specific phospholipase C [Janthinobacterium sp. LB2P10]|uniref:Ca2+-dependent phosphoinositide-specific phospholipase C n=1 Tax=Janthinobacterium sp. LB2P10 TaxID=3424194 RepID=UPI003F222099